MYTMSFGTLSSSVSNSEVKSKNALFPFLMKIISSKELVESPMQGL